MPEITTGAAALILVLMGANVWAQYHVVRAREAAVNQQFCDITKKVLGKEVCEPSVARYAIRTPLNGFSCTSDIRDSRSWSLGLLVQTWRRKR